MFSGFKYRLAKNKVLMSLEVKGVLSKGKSKLMRDIMYNDMNKELGIDCIKQNLTNKYQCVAFVFARLQYLYEKNPRNDLSSYDWYYPTTVSYTHLTLPTILLV